MMPTASAPSAAIARSTTASIAGRASLPSPSSGIGRKANVFEFDVAGAAAAEPRKIAQGETGRAVRHQEQAELARCAVTIGDTRRNDDLSGGIAVEHRGLAAIEPPAFRRLFRNGRTSARSKRAARSECANARNSEPSAIFGSSACFCASLPHSDISAAPITTVER